MLNQNIIEYMYQNYLSNEYSVDNVRITSNLTVFLYRLWFLFTVSASSY
jgi:hypothetical protein